MSLELPSQNPNYLQASQPWQGWQSQLDFLRDSEELAMDEQSQPGWQLQQVVGQHLEATGAEPSGWTLDGVQTSGAVQGSDVPGSPQPAARPGPWRLGSGPSAPPPTFMSPTTPQSPWHQQQQQLERGGGPSSPSASHTLLEQQQRQHEDQLQAEFYAMGLEQPPQQQYLQQHLQQQLYQREQQQQWEQAQEQQQQWEQQMLWEEQRQEEQEQGQVQQQWEHAQQQHWEEQDGGEQQQQQQLTLPDHPHHLDLHQQPHPEHLEPLPSTQGPLLSQPHHSFPSHPPKSREQYQDSVGSGYLTDTSRSVSRSSPPRRQGDRASELPSSHMAHTSPANSPARTAARPSSRSGPSSSKLIRLSSVDAGSSAAAPTTEQTMRHARSSPEGSVSTVHDGLGARTRSRARSQLSSGSVGNMAAAVGLSELLTHLPEEPYEATASPVEHEPAQREPALRGVVAKARLTSDCTSVGRRTASMGGSHMPDEPSNDAASGTDPALLRQGALEEDLAAVMKRLPASSRYGARDGATGLVTAGLVQQLYSRISRLQGLLKQREEDVSAVSAQVQDVEAELARVRDESEQQVAQLTVAKAEVDAQLQVATRQMAKQPQQLQRLAPDMTLGGGQQVEGRGPGSVAHEGEEQQLRGALQQALADLAAREQQLVAAQALLAERNAEVDAAALVLQRSEAELAERLGAGALAASRSAASQDAARDAAEGALAARIRELEAQLAEREQEMAALQTRLNTPHQVAQDPVLGDSSVPTKTLQGSYSALAVPGGPGCETPTRHGLLGSPHASALIVTSASYHTPSHGLPPTPGTPMSSKQADEWRKAAAKERADKQALASQLEGVKAELAAAVAAAQRGSATHTAHLNDVTHRAGLVESQLRDALRRLAAAEARLTECLEDTRQQRSMAAARGEEVTAERDANRRLRLQISVLQGSVEVLQQQLAATRADLAATRKQELAEEQRVQKLSRQAEELEEESTRRLRAAEDIADRLSRAYLESLLDLRGEAFCVLSSPARKQPPLPSPARTLASGCVAGAALRSAHDQHGTAIAQEQQLGDDGELSLPGSRRETVEVVPPASSTPVHPAELDSGVEWHVGLQLLPRHLQLDDGSVGEATDWAQMDGARPHEEQHQAEETNTEGMQHDADQPLSQPSNLDQASTTVL